MAITGTNLASASSTTDGLTFTTASITPAANSLILIAMGWTVSSAPVSTIASITGNGITYTNVVTSVATAAKACTLYRGMAASPSAGAITFTFNTTAATSCFWCITQFTGTDTSGTNGSGAIVQSIATTTATSTLTPSLAFTTTPSAANGGFGALLSSATGTTGTAGTSWTSDGFSSQLTPASCFIGEHANSACPSAVTATLTGTTGNNWIVGAEILPAGNAVTLQRDFAATNRARFRAATF